MAEVTYSKCRSCDDGYISSLARENGYTICWDCIEAAKGNPCFACDDPADSRSEDGKRCAVCEHRFWLKHGPDGFVGGFERWQEHVEAWRVRAGIDIEIPKAKTLHEVCEAMPRLSPEITRGAYRHRPYQGVGAAALSMSILAMLGFGLNAMLDVLARHQ